MQAQRQVEATKAAQAYYQKALQELTLFKSKTSAALLQVPLQHKHKHCRRHHNRAELSSNLQAIWALHMPSECSYDVCHQQQPHAEHRAPHSASV